MQQVLLLGWSYEDVHAYAHNTTTPQQLQPHTLLPTTTLLVVPTATPSISDSSIWVLCGVCTQASSPNWTLLLPPLPPLGHTHQVMVNCLTLLPRRGATRDQRIILPIPQDQLQDRDREYQEYITRIEERSQHHPFHYQYYYNNTFNHINY